MIIHRARNIPFGSCRPSHAAPSKTDWSKTKMASRIHKNPFGARVPAMPAATRRAAPVWQFNAVVIGLAAILIIAILAPLSVYLAGSRLIEIEAQLAAAARV
jgi:hypothetical protein